MYAFGGCRIEKRIVRCEKASQEISKGPKTSQRNIYDLLDSEEKGILL